MRIVRCDILIAEGERVKASRKKDSIEQRSQSWCTCAIARCHSWSRRKISDVTPQRIGNGNFDRPCGGHWPAAAARAWPHAKGDAEFADFLSGVPPRGKLCKLWRKAELCGTPLTGFMS